MIKETAADILNRIKSVPSLAESASLSIGGRSADPGLIKIPLPAAWITFAKDENDQQSYTHGNLHGVNPIQSMMMTFAVTVFVPYISDEDLLATQYPLLEAIVVAVTAQNELEPLPSGYDNWRFAGQRIALVYPDRLAYEQRYTVNYVPQTIS